ncbi:sugar-binding transcriptional regulator [Pelagibius sp.]|uniref:sugar-binding transcriptional regulator n=1 Tax=Pelagibius sp. TaxID=1931238 RepID=UPI00175EE76F|nr:sugar-binding transcriptional regulator [Pelagibius sp.]HIC82434.1 sugar-binding transcriptional regulator [Kiloniellaceae bacterium]
MVRANHDAQRLGDEAQRETWPEQLAVRICWHYYMLGRTQQEIAETLGINRVRVNRLLAEARRRGIVRVTIHSKLAENVALEQQLAETYGLDLVEVVIGGVADEAQLAEVLGRAAAGPLSALYDDGMTIGIAWGVTLKAMAQATEDKPLRDAAVVSMLGSLTRRSSVDAFEATTDLAARLHAECYYLPGPIVCDSEESRDTILQQPMMREVYLKTQSADLALASVGGVDSSTIRRMGFVDDAEFREASKAGAIGNFLGYYIDAEAQILDHPINRRVLGFPPSDFIKIPRRVMVSGGPAKVPVLRALLERGYFTDLVTDTDTAKALLEPA